MKHGLHVCILKLEDWKRNWPDTCANELFLWVIECQRGLKQRECLDSIIEKEVYGLVVKSQHESFQEVDEVISELVVLAKSELKLNQLGQKWIAKQVEQMCLVFDILNQDGDGLDDLNGD